MNENKFSFEKTNREWFTWYYAKQREIIEAMGTEELPYEEEVPVITKNVKKKNKLRLRQI